MARRRRRKSSGGGGAIGTGLLFLLALALLGRLYEAVSAEPLFGVPGVVLTAIGLATIVLSRSQRSRSNAKTLADLLALTPTQFEDATANLLHDLGYRDVKRNGGAGDLNVDVWARDSAGQRVAVQCKQYRPGHTVGSPEVQTFIGMIYQHHRAGNGIFVTTSTFTAPAIKLARDNNIVLWDGQEVARRLVQVQEKAAAATANGGGRGRVWAYSSLPVGLLLLCSAWMQSSPSAAPPAVTAAVVPTTASISPSPTTKPTPAPATATPMASPTPGAVLVQVTNTGSMGVYLRRTPTMDDKLRAYQDGTTLRIVGPDVVAEGITWRHVAAPDQVEGYVPSEYTQSNP